MGVRSWFRSRRALKRGIDAQRNGRLREATSAFEERLEMTPGDWQAWCGLGECHRELGQLDAAERAFTRCLDLNPKSLEAQEGLACIHGERDNQWSRRLDGLEKVLIETTKAGVPEITELGIAWAHHMRGDVSRALEFFERALDHMSKWPDLGVKLDAQFAETEYQIGVLYDALKSDRDRALEHLRRAAELSPESVFAKRAGELIESITRAT